MEYFPAPLEKLVEQFARLPGVGHKSAQRLAFYVLSLPEQEAQAFADAIMDAKRNVTLCPVCQNLTAGGLCPICADQKRDDATICVVADPGRDRHRAQPGVPRPLPCASRRAVPHEPRGAR